MPHQAEEQRTASLSQDEQASLMAQHPINFLCDISQRAKDSPMQCAALLCPSGKRV